MAAATAGRCSKARWGWRPRDFLSAALPQVRLKQHRARSAPRTPRIPDDADASPLLPLPILALLAACQSEKAPALNSGGKSAALRKMEQIAIAAHACWFVSKDPAFKPYHMANELNSFSGRPRFLLVPAKHPEGKPLLVVQAEGAGARCAGVRSADGRAARRTDHGRRAALVRRVRRAARPPPEPVASRRQAQTRRLAIVSPRTAGKPRHALRSATGRYP